jgi:hypothetical protein
MSLIYTGDHVLAIRQISDNAFTGVLPKGPESSEIGAPDIEYKPFAGADKIIKYRHPQDPQLIKLSAGGRYCFTEGNFPVIIKELRYSVDLGTITVTIGDLGDEDHDIDITSFGEGGADRLVFRIPAYVLPSQQIKVSSSVATEDGFIDLYVVKANS